MNPQQLKNILEAALLAAEQPLPVDRMLSLFTEDEAPSVEQIREAMELLAADCETRGIELKEVGSGYRLQVKKDFSPWISRMWEEKPARYSRALLETLALIAYRQPITRAEIEEVRGVSVSTHIIKTLQEREWVRVLGHRDVPGRPALYGTTRQFLDYFNMKSLEELPTLADIRSLDEIGPREGAETAEPAAATEETPTTADAPAEPLAATVGDADELHQAGEDEDGDTTVEPQAHAQGPQPPSEQAAAPDAMAVDEDGQGTEAKSSLRAGQPDRDSDRAEALVAAPAQGAND